MSDTEEPRGPRATGTTTHQAPTAPAVSALSFTSNFPVPAPMKISGDRINNWEFFRQQWEDYELATGLDKRPEAIRLATLKVGTHEGTSPCDWSLRLVPGTNSLRVHYPF